MKDESMSYLDALKEIKRLKETLDKIRIEIEQLPTKTRTNWDGCCPDIDYPEIEYVDVSREQLLEIIDKYKAESEEKINDRNNKEWKDKTQEDMYKL